MTTEAMNFGQLRTASVDGVSLAYREQGEGEPVILVHGSSSDLRTWELQVPAIGSKFRSITYSRRYARPNRDIDEGDDDPMLVHVDDLVAFASAIKAAPAHLVGHSWGGFIALLTAIRYPEAVRSLVLMEPPVLSLFVSTPPKPVEILRILLQRPSTALAIIRFGATAFEPARKAFLRGDDEAATRSFGYGVLGRKYFERLSEKRLQQVRANRKADRAQILGAGFPPLDDDSVRAVAKRCLLLVGENSPTLMRRLSERLCVLLPSVDFIEIDNASHLMHEDNPDAVNRAILDFLSRHRLEG